MSFCHPIDVVKVQIQLTRNPAGQIIRDIVQTKGVKGFMSGWSAQMARQLSYGTVRLGSFGLMKEKMSTRDADGRVIPVSFPMKVTLGLIAGILGAVAGNPAEVALVRMQGDSLLPAAERRGYKNVVQAIYRVIREEGVTTLWRGTGPTIARAVAINGSALSSYDEVKETVDRKMGTTNGFAAICAGSSVSGVMAAAASMPFDFLKTQIQTMRPDEAGKMPYTGMPDCARQTFAKHGPFGFYAGFPVYVLRIAPAVVLIFFALEGVNEGQRRLGL